jgi:hypothetical protein
VRDTNSETGKGSTLWDTNSEYPLRGLQGMKERKKSLKVLERGILIQNIQYHLRKFTVCGTNSETHQKDTVCDTNSEYLSRCLLGMIQFWNSSRGCSAEFQFRILFKRFTVCDTNSETCQGVTVSDANSEYSSRVGWQCLKLKSFCKLYIVFYIVFICDR